MRTVFAFASILLVLAVGAQAAPVGAISSASSFEIRGVVVPTEGVSSWPLLAGDEVAAGASPAIIRFNDGSSVVLAAGTRARIESQHGVSTLLLLGGAMSISTSSNPIVRFSQPSGPVSTPPLSTVSVGSSGQKAGGSIRKEPVFTPDAHGTSLR